MKKKPYRKQQDRFLANLPYQERAYQKSLRTRIINEDLLAIA